ncbi:hypothetical protein ABUU27_11180, partial [Escherichia coli]
MPAVDLSELPTPQIIETPDFEVILKDVKESMITAFPQTQQAAVRSAMNRPGFPGECFICELRLPDHRFRWKHNKLFLLL